MENQLHIAGLRGVSYIHSACFSKPQLYTFTPKGEVAVNDT